MKNQNNRSGFSGLDKECDKVRDKVRDEGSRLPFSDAAAEFPPVDWRAAWIWSDEPTAGTHDYVYFRREFSLETLPGGALLRLATARRHHVGQRFHGPCRHRIRASGW